MASNYQINIERLSKLNVEDIYSSRTQLYKDLFDFEKKPSSNQMKYMDKEVNRYLEYDKVKKNGNKIKITKIFDKPKEYVDKRGGSNNTIYISNVEKLLLNKGTFILISSDIFADIYNIGDSNIFSVVRKSNEQAWNFISMVKDKLNDITKTALNKLERENKIEWEFIWVKAEKGEIVLLTKEESNIVDMIQASICRDMDKPLNVILSNYYFSKEYYTKFNEMIKKYSFQPFKAYSVINKTDTVCEDIDEIYYAKESLKEEVGYYVYKKLLNKEEWLVKQRGFRTISKSLSEININPNILRIYCSLFNLSGKADADEKYQERYDKEIKG